MGRAEDLRDELRASGEAAIDRMIRERESEGQWLDFKNRGDGKDNEKNLSEAVSAFANTDGGVLVWGVDARATRQDPADVAKAKHPFDDPAGFVGWLQSVTSRVTVPVVTGVDHFAIPTADGRGFVVTYVPASPSLPHRAARGEQYFMRSGSSSVVIAHAVLAGMFGRRPAPYVRPLVVVMSADRGSPNQFRMRVGVSVVNSGTVIARDAYVSLRSCGPAPPAFLAAFRDNAADTPWFVAAKHDRRDRVTYQYAAIARHDALLAPGTFAVASVIDVSLRHPHDADPYLEGIIGCDGVLPATFRLVFNAATRQRLLDAFGGRQTVTEDDAAAWARQGLPGDALVGGEFLHLTESRA